MPIIARRIGETDLIVPALQMLNGAPGGFLKTSELITKLENWFEPDGDDAKILDGRHDTRFSQIVRNMVSHRKTPGNIVERGFAVYERTRKGLQITDQGVSVLSKVA